DSAADGGAEGGLTKGVDPAVILASRPCRSAPTEPRRQDHREERWAAGRGPAVDPRGRRTALDSWRDEHPTAPPRAPRLPPCGFRVDGGVGDRPRGGHRPAGRAGLGGRRGRLVVDPGRGGLLRLGGAGRLRAVRRGGDGRGAAGALPGAPLGGHRRRDLHPHRLDRPGVAAGPGEPDPDRGPHPGLGGADVQGRHAGGADRLARGVLDHRRARRGAGAGDLRGARDARGRAAGRRDVTGRGDGGGAPGEDRGAGARPEEAPVSGPAAEAAGPVGRGEGAEASGGPAAAPGGGPTGAAAPEDGGAEQGAEDGEWRKLSPMMLVVAPVTYLKNFIIPLILMAFGA